MESEYIAEWPMPEARVAAEFLINQQNKKKETISPYVAELVEHCQIEVKWEAQRGCTL